MSAKVLCSECGDDFEVVTAAAWWTAWGRNCADFNWEKQGAEPLCESCENEWCYCAECGSLIDAEHYGAGYPEGDDFPDETICPECIELKGVTLNVNVCCSVEGH